MQLEFESPYLLWSLLLLMPLTFFMWHKKRKQPASFAWRRLVLTTLGFALCLVGLSRPQLGMRVTESQTMRSNVFLAMDVSKSMLAQDISPSRIGFGIAFAQRLLQQLSGIKVAIYPFALDGYIQMPLTTDVYAAADMLSALNPTIMTSQGTDLSSSLEDLLVAIGKMQAATTRNGGDWFPTQVVLISDGESHKPLRDEVTKEYRKRKIPIFTVGVGTPGGGTIPVESRYALDREFLRDSSGKIVRTVMNADNLKRLADQTGGDYFTSRFEEVYRLSKNLTQSMHLGKLSTNFRADHEIFPVLFALALLCFLIEFSFGRWHYAVRASLLFALLIPLSARSAEPAGDVNEDPETRAVRTYNLGLEYLRQGNTNRAAEMFQESALLTQSRETKKKALFNLGNTYLRASDPVQALEAYQQSLETKADDKKLDADAKQRTYDNIALAQRLLEKMQKQPSQGEGEGKKGGEGKNKPGDQGADPKGPQKDFQAQNFNDTQKQRIFDLISADEQQIMQRVQDEKNKKGSSRFNDKPW